MRRIMVSYWEGEARIQIIDAKERLIWSAP